MNPNSNHDKFLLYLESLHRFDEETRLELIHTAEERLPVLLQNCGIQTEGDIYNQLKIEIWEKVNTDYLVEKISTDNEWRIVGLTLNALKYFKGFIKFNQTANYKKLFEAQTKREKAKLASLAKKRQAAENPDNTIPESENTARPEGSVSQVCVTHYERNPEDRQKALEKYGYVCQVCGMNFEEVYGEIGKDFIEVHHMYPVCNMGEDYVFDPLDEERGLIPLCSNCHSMIHRGGRKEERNGKQVMIPLTLHELRKIYQKKNKK